MPKQLETAVSHYNTYIDLVLNGNGAGALSCATISGPGRFFFSRPAVLLSCSSRSFFGDFYCRSFEFPALSRHPIDFQMVFFFLSVFPSISISFSLFLFVFSCRVSFSFLVLEFDCVCQALNVPMFTFSDCLFSFYLMAGDSELEMMGSFSLPFSQFFLKKIQEKEINPENFFFLRNWADTKEKNWNKENTKLFFFFSFEMVVIITMKAINSHSFLCPRNKLKKTQQEQEQQRNMQNRCNIFPIH
jgi:hypothetical protein